MSGFFVALEGIDGSGTTTQAGRLAHELRQHFSDRRVLVTAEPSQSGAGQMVREWLKKKCTYPDDAVALLFAADRLIHYYDEIEPVLRAGGIVISDRYRLSSLVYQSFFSDPLWVSDINSMAPSEDLVILLDISADVAMGRLANRVKLDRMERLKIQQKVRNKYLEYVREAQISGRTVIIDGNKNQDQITKIITERVLSAMGAK